MKDKNNLGAMGATVNDMEKITAKPRISFNRSYFESPPTQKKKTQTAGVRIFFFGAPPGTRTLDPLIKSQLLYQLS